MILVLDGDHPHSRWIAREICEAHDIAVGGVGRDHHAPLLRSQWCARAWYADARTEGYPLQLLSIIEASRPQCVVPVGFRSVKALDAIRDRIDPAVRFAIPNQPALESALDKRRTLAIAQGLGISVPIMYDISLGELPERYPVFLKAAHEAGHNITSLVGNADELRRSFDELKLRSPEGEVLCQEYIDGSTSTFAFGGLYLGGTLRLSYCHEEMRSVPRTGGSGTWLRTVRVREVEEASIRLLEALQWNGIALVEFKRRQDGTFALMEINPKFWASYALAASSGHLFAAKLVADLLDRPFKSDPPKLQSELVFPARELSYVFRNWRNESLLAAVGAMSRKGVARDISISEMLGDFVNVGMRAINRKRKQ